MGAVTTDLRVGNLMSINPVVIEPDASASEAERLLKMYRVSGLPVVENSVTVGVISQTDLVSARSSELVSANWPQLRVRHLMTTPALTVHVETSVKRAAELMVSRHVHRLVVIDGEDRAVGVVSSLDLLRALIDDASV
ncbi:MAG TPA: CBS domain-containing protein [Candidatus Limnocylindria bacterium]|nr:CBS domain-containing protein [Candidatus Limnocylindria bacterium]